MGCANIGEVTCGEPFRHFVPPVWRMNDPTDTVYTGPAYFVLTTDADETSVTIATPDGSWTTTVTARRTTELRVPVPTEVMQAASANERRRDRGVVIASDAPVNAVFAINGHLSKTLVTMKGERALGTAFRAGSQVPDRTCPEVSAPDTDAREAHFVSVIATEDDTRVTFDWDPAVTTYHGLSGGTHAVTLQAGESYLLRDAYTNETVSGTGIAADKAIAVISGSQHTRLCTTTGRDAGIDQLVPACYVGTEYVAVKHQGLNSQHYVVVVPTEDDTEVWVNGWPQGTVDVRGYRKILVSSNVGGGNYVRTSKPAYVYHFSGVSNNDEVGMALAASFGTCQGNRHLTFASMTDDPSARQDLSVIMRFADMQQLLLNGESIWWKPDVSYNLVQGKTDFVALVIPKAYFRDVNTLTAPSYFQAALLVGLSGSSGTYGYLTRFGQSIQVRDPASGRPSGGYALGATCGSAPLEHTLDVIACDGSVRIVAADNDGSLGTVAVTADLQITYTADARAYGRDDIRLRLRDADGLETSVCLSVAVCGDATPIEGLPASRTLACGEAIPADSAHVAEPACAVRLPIPHTDRRVEGACSGSYAIVRTWTRVSECGAVLEAERTFTYVDASVPVLADVPGPLTRCAGEGLPATAPPTATDDCGGRATVAEGPPRRVDYPGTGAFDSIRTWTATDACGNTATATQRVRFEAVPAASAIPLDPTGCGRADGEIDVTVTDDPDRTHVELSIDGGQTYARTPDDVGVYAFTGLRAGVYAVAARWSGGACVVDLGPVTVSDPTAPVADFSADGPDDCDGSAETFTATEVRDAVYTWTFPPGSVPETATGRVASAALYTDRGSEDLPVTLTVERAGCSASTTKTVTRRTSARALVAAVAPIDPSSCSRDDGRLDLTAPDPTDGCIEFSVDGSTWTRGRSLTGLAAGSYTLRARYCDTACEEAVGTYTLAPATPPTVTAGEDLAVCAGSEATLTATATGGSAPYSYSWSDGAGTGSSATVTAASTTTYTATVTDAVGCTATAQQTVAVSTAGVASVAINPLGGGAPVTIENGDRFHLSRLPGAWNLLVATAGDPARLRLDLTGRSSTSTPATAYLGTATVPRGGEAVYRTPGTHLGLPAGTYQLRTRAYAEDAAAAEACADLAVEFHLEDYEICDNGVDDDGDGATDCEDASCPPPAPVLRIERR